MKKITVISGKGGTGKTTVISNLAALAKDVVIADCDVDAPNMHLLMKPRVLEERIFESARVAIKAEEGCTSCGVCRDVCRFGAITPELEINPIKCDGCGVCVALCPEGVLKLEKQITGNIYLSETQYGPMVHARLKAGAENSGKLVSEVRDIAERVAVDYNQELILIDGSPGIGCPVIASLKGIDYALIVTEPTMSGLSDLKRIMEVTILFKIPALVVINKYDLNKEIAESITMYCQDINIPVIGKISFSPLVNKVLRKGELLVKQVDENEPARQIKEIWEELGKYIG
jgi:MinD superfamily P-loop ATPase